MDDELKIPKQVDRLTSDRVEKMSEEARAELARNLAARRGSVTDEPGRPAAPVRHTRIYREVKTPDRDAGAAVRIAAELHRTERRLDRLERSFSHSRYQTGSSGPPSGRYARLLARADRLERQLRSLG